MTKNPKKKTKNVNAHIQLSAVSLWLLKYFLVLLHINSLKQCEGFNEVSLSSLKHLVQEASEVDNAAALDLKTLFFSHLQEDFFLLIPNVEDESSPTLRD